MVDHDEMRDMPPEDGTTLGTVELTPEDQAEIDRRNSLRGEQVDVPVLKMKPWKSRPDSEDSDEPREVTVETAPLKLVDGD